MNTLPRLLLLLGLAHLPAVAADSIIDTVRHADDQRVAATLAADKDGLNAALSTELHYTHASGRIDTKASYMGSFLSHSTIYDTYRYVERTFLPAGTGSMLMYGRALIDSRNGEKKTAHDLNFLAVWREENGVWRLLAWQSAENPPPAPPAKP